MRDKDASDELCLDAILPKELLEVADSHPCINEHGVASVGQE
jgi:hypothetical protein